MFRTFCRNWSASTGLHAALTRTLVAFFRVLFFLTAIPPRKKAKGATRVAPRTISFLTRL